MFYKTVVRVFFLVFVAFVVLAPYFFRLAFCFFAFVVSCQHAIFPLNTYYTLQPLIYIYIYSMYTV